MSVGTTISPITGLKRFDYATFRDGPNSFGGPAYEAGDVEKLVAALNAKIVSLVMGIPAKTDGTPFD
jgi:hypothetical protein